MPVTLRDVAVLAGVSTITASRALNNSGYVSPPTRARVRAAADELHYVRNAVAGSLRSRKTQLFAFLTGITNPFWAAVDSAIEDAALDAGYSVILCNTDENPAKEARYVELLRRMRVDGLIIAPTHDGLASLQDLGPQQLPFVLIDRQVSGVAADCVRGDSRGGAQQLTAHLLATGYREIGMITGAPTVSTAVERAAGYREALGAAGVPVDETLVRFGGYNASWGYRATQELMARRPRPAAIFAANNFLALGVLEALHTLGLRVPQDVAMVCFDDTTQPNAARFLTTVVQPAAEMGRIAVRLLLDRIARPDKPAEDVVLPVDFIVRQSCGCRPALDPGAWDGAAAPLAGRALAGELPPT